VVCTAGAKQSGTGLQATVRWADGLSTEVPHEVLKMHIVSANALLDYMVGRVRKRQRDRPPVGVPADLSHIEAMRPS